MRFAPSGFRMMIEVVRQNRHGRLVALLFVATMCGALLLSAPDPARAASFSDVGAGDWFYQAVGELSDAGVINGFSDGTFRPYQTVTRAQFAAMVARALAVPAGSAVPFTDVYSSDWFFGAVSGLHNLGLVSGTSATTFSPQGAMERQQAASLIIRSVGYRLQQEPIEGLGLDLAEEETAAWLQGFKDRSFIAPVHRPAVANAFRLNIVSGYEDERFYPIITLTRAQAAGIIHQGLYRSLVVRGAPPEPVSAEESYPSQRVGSTGPLVSMLETKLAALGYQPGVVDGVFDQKTREAVIAFQKVERLSRDGVAGAEVWNRLSSARRPVPRASRAGARIEIDLTRQVLFYIEDGTVTRIYPVSSGRSGRLTPTGSYSVVRKIPGWRESYLGFLYKPAYFYGGYAVHGSHSVPTYPASSGCVRVSTWTMDVLYPLLPIGTRVNIYY